MFLILLELTFDFLMNIKLVSLNFQIAGVRFENCLAWPAQSE